jgi:hypothetical protein
MSKAAELAALIGSQTALSNRNLIINGAMQVDQRNTTTTATGYALDRYYCAKENFDEAVVAITQDTDSPDNFSNSLKYAVTTAESSLASDEIMYISQKIEAQNLQHLNFGSSAAKSITLSFFVKSSLTGKYSVLMYSDDAVRSNLQSYTINSANTWEKKTITFDGDTAGSGINNDNGTGFWLFFTLAAGSDYTGTPHTGWGAYSATDDFAHSDAVNFAAQTGEFFITGIQLEVGDVATPFEHRSIGDELARCQRYYHRIVPNDSGGAPAVASGVEYTTTSHFFTYHHPVAMRAGSTLGYSNISHMRVYTAGTSAAMNGLSRAGGTDITSELNGSTASGIGTAGNGIWFRAFDASAYVDFDAEL